MTALRDAERTVWNLGDGLIGAPIRVSRIRC